MKVFNLTDIATKTLSQHNLVNQQVVVGSAIVAPGSYGEVEDSPHRRSQLAFLLSIGAVCIDRLPPNYVRDKSLRLSAEKVIAPPPEEPKAEEEIPTEPESPVAIADLELSDDGATWTSKKKKNKR